MENEISPVRLKKRAKVREAVHTQLANVYEEIDQLIKPYLPDSVLLQVRQKSLWMLPKISDKIIETLRL